MMRTDIIDTMYEVIEATDDAIEDLLDHHCIRKHAYLCLLSKHMDNLKDAVCILDMLGEEEIYERAKGIYHHHHHAMTNGNGNGNGAEIVPDKPVIVKKS